MLWSRRARDMPLPTLALLSLALCVCAAHPYQNGPQFRCLFYRGECVSRCPRQMHPYHTRCDQDTVSQRTCTSRYIYSIGFTCGWSRCDCSGGLVLDEEEWRCVREEECPPAPRARRRRPGGVGRRLRLRVPHERSDELVSSIG